MNIVPYENPIKAQEVAATSMDEFLQRIQNILVRGGHNFLIQNPQLEKLVKGKAHPSPKEKAGPPKNINDIERILNPPGFSKEGCSKKNVVGKVFLRNCNFSEQFQIGNLRKGVY